jgi:hypothetical protein
MDVRQMYPQTCERRPHEAPPQNPNSPRPFRMVASYEHDLLIAGGHYRCPHCRRADAMETSPAGRSRR